MARGKRTKKDLSTPRQSRTKSVRNTRQTTTSMSTVLREAASQPPAVVSTEKPTTEKATLLVHKEQSMDIMTLVTRSIVSVIAIERNLFKNDGRMFVHSFINSSHSDTTCKEYKESVEFDAHEEQLTGISIPALIPSDNNTANKLLGWVTIGIAQALQDEFLSSFQLGFYKDAVLPANLIEAYIVNFNYVEGIPSMAVKYGKKILNVKDVKDKWVQFVLDLQQQLADQDPLPAKTKVSMSLTYNDNAPEGYTPNGFGPCKNPKLIIDNESDSEVLGSLSTGLDCVQVKLYKDRITPAETRSPMHSGPATLAANPEIDGSLYNATPRAAFSTKGSDRNTRGSSLDEDSAADSDSTQGASQMPLAKLRPRGRLEFSAAEYQQQAKLAGIGRRIRHPSGLNTQDTVRLSSQHVKACGKRGIDHDGSTTEGEASPMPPKYAKLSQSTLDSPWNGRT